MAWALRPSGVAPAPGQPEFLRSLHDTFVVRTLRDTRVARAVQRWKQKQRKMCASTGYFLAGSISNGHRVGPSVASSCLSSAAKHVWPISPRMALLYCRHQADHSTPRSLTQSICGHPPSAAKNLRERRVWVDASLPRTPVLIQLHPWRDRFAEIRASARPRHDAPRRVRHTPRRIRRGRARAPSVVGGRTSGPTRWFTPGGTM